MKDVPNFTNKPNVYCSVCNLTKTKVIVSKHEHRRKPKYLLQVISKQKSGLRPYSVRTLPKAYGVYDSAPVSVVVNGK